MLGEVIEMNQPEQGNGRVGLGQALRASTSEMTAVFILCYGLAAIMLYALITWGGVWNWLSGTRMLRFLMDAGIVALTDADHGFILGVPDHAYYIGSLDPVGWGVLALSILLLFAHLAVKAIQFHGIASFCGSNGSLGQHARAYIYGEGLGRVLPLNLGNTATVSALVGQGLSERRAAYAVYIGRLFTVFEVALFGAVALFMLGWATWFSALLWALVILAVAYFLTRNTRPGNANVRPLEALRQTVLYLSTRPMQLIALGLLSVLAWLLLDLIAYFIAAAYSSEHVILHFPHEALLMALVAGYTASLIQITPGGMGQFEWGFAAALYLAGVGQPEAMIMAILYQTFRIIVSLVALVAIGTIFGIETSFRRVLRVFRGDSLQPLPAAT